MSDAASDVEVWIDRTSGLARVGLLRAYPSRGGETTTFAYDAVWLADPERFALEPALPLGPGTLAPTRGRTLAASLGDSAPDTWGRRLLQRRERRRAALEKRRVRTLGELGYLLGVDDRARLGALRFRRVGESAFVSAEEGPIPPLVRLGALLASADRLERDEETDDDLRTILAPGSSLGGARPKCSVVDLDGALWIAKFPKATDEYAIEAWEFVAMQLAARAGIAVPEHRLERVGDRDVLLTRRFDRHGSARIPFLSALALVDAIDGERGSYPEIVDALQATGSAAQSDARDLYRRAVFNVLVSNVDDHLRNHGFLRVDRHGWRLAPAYDLNPVPTDVRPRVLSTNIDLDDATCSLDLLEASCGYYGLDLRAARAVVCEVATATAAWRETARASGRPRAEIERMASAFEHDDAERARRLY